MLILIIILWLFCTKKCFEYKSCIHYKWCYNVC